MHGRRGGVIDAYASEPHYADHIAPIWAALPAEMRGVFWCHRRIRPLLEAAGVAASEVRPALPDRSARPLIVASSKDLTRGPGRPVVFVEHGAGQTYGDGNHGYPGGVGRGGVRLFLCPSQRVAALNLAAYPTAQTAVVGSPRLDRWHARKNDAHARRVIGLAWHWDCRLHPETRTAWPHYGPPALRSLADAFPGQVIGHAHPRILSRIAHFYEEAGIPVVDVDELFARASLLAADNTSLLPEFASTGRPVLWLNAPWYRRQHHHGGRFWEWPAGQIACDGPGQLVDAVRRALADPPDVRAARGRMVAAVFARCDGRAAERAAEAVVAWFASRHG